MSLMDNALSELTWLPCPKYPTNFNTSGLLPLIFNSFIFWNFAAWALTKIDSLVELFMIPPPLFFSKNASGSPIVMADQSTIVFSSSVQDGATEKLKLGVWKVVANISARTDVTLIDEGQYPKYLGDCQFINPGNMIFLVLSSRWSMESPLSGGVYGKACLRKPGLTSGCTGASVWLQSSLINPTICWVPLSRVSQSQNWWDMVLILNTIISTSRFDCLQSVILTLQTQLINQQQMHKESSLETKQQYLRQKIIDAGYDPELFVQFCSEKHDLDDLENWSMRELTDIVHAFVQLNSSHPHKASEEKEHRPTHAEHPNTASTTSIQSIPKPVPQNKLAIVFSDDDWNMLLSGPSLIHDTLQQSKSKPISPIIDFNFAPLVQPEPKIELGAKDSPLSPPSSISQPRQLNIALVNVEKPTLTQKELPLEELDFKSEAIRSQKLDKKPSSSSNAPINLSNVKIFTAKQKVLLPLPVINDVVVVKTEQVYRNFLQGDYTLYHIQFQPSKHIIQRKFADLRRVRTVLQRFYPFLRLPYLQPEGWISSSEGKDPQNLAKYKWMVEQFFRYLIVKSDELKNNEIVRTFCGFGVKGDLSKQDLKKRLDIYQNLQKPKFIGEVLLTDNSILIPPVSNGEKMVSNTLNLINEIDLQYEKLKKQLETLFANYQAMSRTYYDIGGTFQSLENLIKRYNIDNNESNQVRVFEGFRQMTAKLSFRLNQQYQMFRNRIKGFFRYEKDNLTSLKETIENRNKIHSEYIRFGSPPLNSGKLKGNCMEIESSIPLEQVHRSNKSIIAVQQIFWSFMTTRQINRYWQLLRRKICEHLTMIAYDELDSQNENLNFWNAMIKKCVF